MSSAMRQFSLLVFLMVVAMGSPVTLLSLTATAQAVNEPAPGCEAYVEGVGCARDWYPEMPHLEHMSVEEQKRYFAAFGADWLKLQSLKRQSTEYRNAFKEMIKKYGLRIQIAEPESRPDFRSTDNLGVGSMEDWAWAFPGIELMSEHEARAIFQPFAKKVAEVVQLGRSHPKRDIVEEYRRKWADIEETYFPLQSRNKRSKSYDAPYVACIGKSGIYKSETTDTEIRIILTGEFLPQNAREFRTLASLREMRPGAFEVLPAAIGQMEGRYLEYVQHGACTGTECAIPEIATASGLLFKGKPDRRGLDRTLVRWHRHVRPDLIPELWLPTHEVGSAIDPGNWHIFKFVGCG